MNVVKVIPISQVWLFPKDCAKLIGRSRASEILTDFRKFCESRPNYFYPRKPWIEYGDSKQYDLYCFAHYYENKALLDAGSRSIKFQNDMKRLKEVY